MQFLNSPFSTIPFPLLRDHVVNPLRFFDTWSIRRDVLHCCCDAVDLICPEVDGTHHFHVDPHLGNCCCHGICCTSLTEFLPELVCKRLHVCGRNLVFQLASTLCDLLDRSVLRYREKWNSDF